MSRFDFTIGGEATDTLLDALFDAGEDDANFSTKAPLVSVFATSDREAPSNPDGVLATIGTVESVDGFELLDVDPDGLVRAAELAERTQVGRASQSASPGRPSQPPRRSQACAPPPPEEARGVLDIPRP